MEYSTCKDQVITYSLACFKANIAKHSKSIDRISFGPVLLLHTRTLMTLFTFRSPFFTNNNNNYYYYYYYYYYYLFIYLFIIFMHVPLFRNSLFVSL